MYGLTLPMSEAIAWLVATFFFFTTMILLSAYLGVRDKLKKAEKLILVLKKGIEGVRRYEL